MCAKAETFELYWPGRLLLRYLHHAAPSFELLLGGPPGSPPAPSAAPGSRSAAQSPASNPGPAPEDPSQLQLARGALRALRRCPALRRRWRPAPFYGLLTARDPDIRWTGAECIALLAGLVRTCALIGCFILLPPFWISLVLA